MTGKLSEHISVCYIFFKKYISGEGLKLRLIGSAVLFTSSFHKWQVREGYLFVMHKN